MWLNINNIPDMPKRESIFEGIVRKYGSLWNVAKYKEWRCREKYPWKIAEYVLKGYIGKYYDEAYSVFCNRLKEYGYKDPNNKRYFDKAITELCRSRINRHYNHYKMFSIDEDKIIHWDLNYFEDKSKWSRRRFPKKLPTLNGYYEVTEYQLVYWDWKLKNRISSYEYFNLSDYDKIKYTEAKVKREYITFDSKHDRAFKRYKHEERKLHKKLNRQVEKNKKEIEYSFLTKDEKRRVEERETDLIKRDSHGFNDESFKGEHYHGQKRKKKELLNVFESLNQLI